MGKTKTEQVAKDTYRCPKCQQESEGPKCQNCGNIEGMIQLAPDKIDKEVHEIYNLFKSLTTAENADLGMMEAKTAAAQLSEINDNMREAYVARSDVKKKEAELNRLKKEAELSEARAAIAAGKPLPPNNSSPHPGGGYVPDNNAGAFPMFPTVDPRAAFMSNLMKMGKEERQEFIAALSDADPQALANFSAMLAPAAPMNIGGGNMNMNGMPPWMAQQMYMQQMQQMMNPQQHQQPQQQADPMELAINIIGAMSEMMGKMAPKPDEGLKEALREIKEEQKAFREKLSTPTSQPAVDIRPLFDKISNLETKLAENSVPRSPLDSLKEAKEFINAMKDAGLVAGAGGATETVDDKLKLKQFDAQQENEKRKLEIEEKKIEAEKAKSAMAQGMLGMMFQRLRANKQEADNLPAAGHGPVKRVSISSLNPSTRSSPAPQPQVVVSKRESEAGVVLETRAPVKKTAADGVISG